MSKHFVSIRDSKDKEMNLTSFYVGKGGGKCLQISIVESEYVELAKPDVCVLRDALIAWLIDN